MTANESLNAESRKAKNEVIDKGRIRFEVK